MTCDMLQDMDEAYCLLLLHFQVQMHYNTNSPACLHCRHVHFMSAAC